MPDGNAQPASGTQAFLAALRKQSRFHFPAAEHNVTRQPETVGWLLEPLARWSEAAYGPRVFDDAALGYVRYCIEVLREQQRYEREGRFAANQASDIAAEVYVDDAYMTPYMWAAILIYGFWPSMTDHLLCYRDGFLQRLPPSASLLEVACGHGVLGLLALEQRSDITVDGVDISAPAISIARRLAAASPHGDRASFQVADALADNGGRVYDAAIAAMLAEHVERPDNLMAAIAQRVRPGGLVFFSTALESAQRDHVFEFRRESEPLLLAEQAGFRVLDLVCRAAPRVNGGRFLPRALAMVLERGPDGSAQ